MSDRFERQSFLGPESEATFAEARVGLIGYGGGGSQIGQQLAHIGFYNVVVADPDSIEDSNLNRLVGGTVDDVAQNRAKVDIARRVFRGVLPKVRLKAFQKSWDQLTSDLRSADILIGCVDSFGQRAALERFARRFLIPYLDIGMDVLKRGEHFKIVGQVILSSPGRPCMRCMGVIDDSALEKEERARQYGDAGSKPQVIWPNGVLASTAVGLVVQLLSPWSGKARDTEYLEYDGNLGTVREAPRLRALLDNKVECKHYRESEVGDPLFLLK